MESGMVSIVTTESRRGVRIPLVYRLLDFQIKDQSDTVSNCMREDCFELAI